MSNFDRVLGIDEIARPSPVRKKPNGEHRAASKEVAADFLRGILAGGVAVAVTELEQRARSGGLLPANQLIGQNKAFRSAKKLLDIRTYQEGRQWLWAMPARSGSPSGDPLGDLPVQPAEGPGDVRENDILSQEYLAPRGDDLTEDDDAVTSAALNLPPKQARAPKPASDEPRLRDIDPATATVLEWTAALSRLDALRPLAGMNPRIWRTFLSDAEEFLTNWAARAAVMKWNACALFGMNSDPGACGLLWLVSGGRIIELFHGGATIETPSGTRKPYAKRQPSPDVILPWRTSHGA